MQICIYFWMNAGKSRYGTLVSMKAVQYPFMKLYYVLSHNSINPMYSTALQNYLYVAMDTYACLIWHFESFSALAEITSKL